MKKIYTYLIIIVFVLISILSIVLGEIFLIPLFFCILPCIGSYRNQRTRNVDQQSETSQQPEIKQPVAQDNREKPIPRVEIRKKGVCYNCGNIIPKENLRFCPNCGSKL